MSHLDRGYYGYRKSNTILDEHSNTFLNLAKQLLCAAKVFQIHIHDTDITYMLSDIIVKKVYDFMINNIVNILKNSCPKYNFDITCARIVGSSKPFWDISFDVNTALYNFRNQHRIYHNLSISSFDNTWRVFVNAYKFHYIRLGQIIYIPEYGNAEIIAVQNKRYVVQYTTGEKYTFKRDDFINILNHPDQLRDVFIDSRLKLIKSINATREECIDYYLSTTPRCWCGETFHATLDNHNMCNQGHNFDPTIWKYPDSDTPMIQDLDKFLSYRQSIIGSR